MKYLTIVLIALVLVCNSPAQFMKRASTLHTNTVQKQLEQKVTTYILFSNSVNGPFTEPDTIFVNDSLFMKMDVSPLDTIFTEYWLDANRNGTIDTSDFNFTGDMLVDNGIGSTNVTDLDATQGVIIAYLNPENPPAMHIVVKAMEESSIAYGVVVFQNRPAQFTVSGTVYDVDDGPVSGLFIGANDSSGQIMTTTDVNGHYELPLDSGTYHIFVSDQFGRYSSTDTQMTIQSNVTKDFYVARYSSYISGYVRDEHGTAIPNIGVGLQQRNGGSEVRTDVNGHYKLMVPAGSGRIGVSQDDLLPQFMGTQSHDFTIADGDSIVNNSVSNFTCYSTNSIISGLVLENGGIPGRTYKISAWVNLLSGYSETTTNGLGMFSLPVRSDTELSLIYNVWLNGENDEYPLPPGMYADTSYNDVSPGDNVTFTIIPAETLALDNFNGHFSSPSFSLWETYSNNNPWGSEAKVMVIDSVLNIRAHSQSGRSGLGIVSRKPYNLNERDIRVVMNKTEMGQKNSAFILLSDERRSFDAPDNFENWLQLWTGDQGDPGWKLVEYVDRSKNVLWESNETSGSDIRFVFESGSNVTLMIDNTIKYQGTWSNIFPMAYVYLIQENEATDTASTVYFDEFRVRHRNSLDVREIGGEIPNEYRLEQNYPNPFNPTTNFGFRIANFGLVVLKVYDVLGREVAEVVNKELSAGNYSVSFDASELPGGVYYYQLRAGSFIETKKLLLMR